MLLGLYPVRPCPRCFITETAARVCADCRSAERRAKILDLALETPTGKGRYSYPRETVLELADPERYCPETPGWYCSREKPHPGPCALWPTREECGHDPNMTLLDGSMRCGPCYYEEKRRERDRGEGPGILVPARVRTTEMP